MKSEYLLFNCALLLIPLAFSVGKRTRFVSYSAVFCAVVLAALPFLLWDAHVAGYHWWFYPAYSLSPRIEGLPLEEILFFLTISFVSLFLWENLSLFVKKIYIAKLRIIRLLLYIALPVGMVLFSHGREYTALVLMALGLVALCDRAFNTHLFLQPKTYIYLAVLALVILLSNGYLTARPIVVYGASYQLGWHVFTIPLENFGFEFSLILFTTILYERFKRGLHP